MTKMTKKMMNELVKNNINSMPSWSGEYENMADEISAKIDAPKSKVMEILKGLKISRLFYKDGYIYEVATWKCGRTGILVEGHIEIARDSYVEESEADVVVMEKKVAGILGYDSVRFVR